MTNTLILCTRYLLRDALPSPRAASARADAEFLACVRRCDGMKLRWRLSRQKDLPGAEFRRDPMRWRGPRI